MTSPPHKLETDDDYEALKKHVIMNSRLVSGLWIGYCIITAIAVSSLPFYIKPDRLPVPIRPFWDSQSLIFIFMIPFILLLRYSPFGRKTVADIPISNAVLTFERAMKECEKWESSKNPKHLKKSYNFILGAGEELSGVPKFSIWKNKIIADYERNIEISY